MYFSSDNLDNLIRLTSEVGFIPVAIFKHNTMGLRRVNKRVKIHIDRKNHSRFVRFCYIYQKANLYED